jgi:hypothetical protein
LLYDQTSALQRTLTATADAPDLIRAHLRALFAAVAQRMRLSEEHMADATQLLYSAYFAHAHPSVYAIFRREHAERDAAIACILPRLSQLPPSTFDADPRLLKPAQSASSGDADGGGARGSEKHALAPALASLRAMDVLAEPQGKLRALLGTVERTCNALTTVNGSASFVVSADDLLPVRLSSPQGSTAARQQARHAVERVRVGVCTWGGAVCLSPGGQWASVRRVASGCLTAGGHSAPRGRVPERNLRAGPSASRACVRSLGGGSCVSLSSTHGFRSWHMRASWLSTY